ncbi:hydrogenase accessory protein HypB [Archaeoglobus sulfaticallidus PM70-1]|uniref:Hydrogenase accessory protein HypB n=1 Tax=Archaeoglobus sulfaticallidus PM70-1 TaxID=387631 RepID=N0BBA1_9EURY|nr:hydrogenase nickel incorporation protein HypB [Archaeoglobus sulfaticallidus]AGK60288.1 hydrogenase accessory protein HypB [Archaeoglobus sulfaticallidus PM70-1]
MHRIEIDAEMDLLSENKRLAEKNREYLKSKGITAINIMGAIGSGKTLLIEKTLQSVDYRVGVILGDVICKADYERVKKYDVSVEPINTGKECHLDAHLISHVIQSFSDVDLILIENVGNLVCPVDFDLGEDYRVVMVSVTEGDDVVEKHPEIFRLADVIIINKIDLAEAVEADVDKMVRDAKRINGSARIIKMDLKSGKGFDEWLEFLRDAVKVR